ncbi:VWA domain-containing protein [Aquihabitans sp. G128]|uniref:VWA domain-containing protein n=1 Tax=Aquihabitans sp. G128 TaxID=2849779 RepID=UPI001C216BC3|nr:VWA domain-containing protein [Aquihabitans sp. G128]QXC59187.1 VWA domain-containing protein [Aquihabitans sp. G128]
MRADRPANVALPPSPAAAAAPEAPVFPFAAVVGTEEAKLALLLSVVDPRLGGVLLRGDKGSAKSTLVRSLAALLPDGGGLTELPLGATEERVAGSLDLASALGGGGVRFSPGVLALAHEGLLYVDEVNLLADHLVDLLLDAAASGRNRVERDGVSHSHDARFVLVGSMNPEEGDLRPQLLDRFGLAVDVRSPADPATRAEVVRRRLAFDDDPAAFTARWAAETEALAARLAAARPAALSDQLLLAASTVCAAAGAEGLRADLTLARAAAAHAGWDGRADATAEDVRAVAHLVLAHRGRRNPLDGSSGGLDGLDDVLDAGLGAPEGGAPEGGAPEGGAPGGGQGAAADGGQAGPGGQGAAPPVDDVTPSAGAPRPADGSAHPDAPDPATGGPTGGTDGAISGESTSIRRRGAPGGEGSSPGSGPSEEREAVAPSADDGQPAGQAVIGAVAAVATRPTAVHHSTKAAPRPRGRTIGHRPVPSGGPAGSLAVVPTAQAAAERRTADPTSAAGITGADLREPVRKARVGHLIVLAVDASGSMGVAGDRLAAAKGALLALLVDAYQRRDRVALVTFRDERAHVALEPTASVELARRRLDGLATGGTTPLAAGLRTATDLARRHAADDLQPVVVLVTDGRATVADRGLDPAQAVADALAVAASVAGTLPFVVVDVEDPNGPRMGLAQRLSDALGAAHVPLGSLTAERLEAVLRGVGLGAGTGTGTGAGIGIGASSSAEGRR